MKDAPSTSRFGGPLPPLTQGLASARGSPSPPSPSGLRFMLSPTTAHPAEMVPGQFGRAGAAGWPRSPAEHPQEQRGPAPTPATATPRACEALRAPHRRIFRAGTPFPCPAWGWGCGVGSPRCVRPPPRDLPGVPGCCTAFAQPG